MNLKKAPLQKAEVEVPESFANDDFLDDSDDEDVEHNFVDDSDDETAIAGNTTKSRDRENEGERGRERKISRAQCMQN